ncbi:MAG: hypothetical protein ACK4YP_17310 [Myxococcota bacterium]
MRLGMALGVALCAACTGEVDVWLVDRSEPDAESELFIGEAELPLDVVEARRADGWVDLARGPNPYNLLDFSGAPTPIDLATLRDEGVRLAHDELPVGEITALRLRLLPDEELELEDEHGIDHDVAPPAPDTLEVPVTVEVLGSRPAVVTLALDVHAAFREEVGGGYVFAPSLTVE